MGTMIGTRIDLDQIGRRRWRLVVVHDGWVVDDRELRGSRRKAKRVAHNAYVADRDEPARRTRHRR